MLMFINAERKFLILFAIVGGSKKPPTPTLSVFPLSLLET